MNHLSLYGYILWPYMDCLYKVYNKLRWAQHGWSCCFGIRFLLQESVICAQVGIFCLFLFFFIMEIFSWDVYIYQIKALNDKLLNMPISVHLKLWYSKHKMYQMYKFVKTVKRNNTLFLFKYNKELIKVNRNLPS